MEPNYVLRLEANGPLGLGMERLELDPADFQSALPEQHWHLYHADEAAGLYVGVWTTTDMQEAFGPYPGDEFMVLLEGRVALVGADGAEKVIEAGEAFTIRNGVPISWKQVGFCRKFFVIWAPPGRERPALASAEGGVSVLARLDAPAGSGASEFESMDGCMTAKSLAGDAIGKCIDDPTHRLVWVERGSLRLTGAEGSSMSLAVGDTVFIPAGIAVSAEADDNARACVCAVRIAP